MKFYKAIILSCSIVSAVLPLRGTTSLRQQVRNLSSETRNPIKVPSGGNLQEALNNAQCGDTIVLQAGGTYSGSFVLPNKGACTGTDSDYITIQSSNLASIPDGRLNPATQVNNLAKIVSNSTSPAINSAIGAHHYKLVGLEITTSGNVFAPDVVDLGSYADRIQQLTAKNFVIDRCFVHSAEISASNLFPSTLLRSSGRGIGLTTADTWIINSYIAGFAGRYLDNSATIDSYGVYSPVGPGPYHIINNYIEAQFNNVFLGGGDCDTPNKATVSNATPTSATFSQVANLRVGDLVAMSSRNSWQDARIDSINGDTVAYTIVTGLYSPPVAAPDNGGTARWNGDHIHNVEIIGNSLWKPDAWNSFSNPKSYVEIKDCVDCLIDGNDMYSGIGTAIAFTVRNQNGSAPWAAIRNLTFSNNRINGYQNNAFGIQLRDNERPSINSGPLLITNNLIIGERPPGLNPAAFVSITGGEKVVVSHNTILQSSALWKGFGFVAANVVLKDNIANSGRYGPFCDLGPTLASCWPGYSTSKNVIIDIRSDPNPALSSVITGSNFYPVNQSAVRFADLAKGDFRLAANSPYKGKASDMKDPGVDMDALIKALAGGAVQGLSNGIPVEVLQKPRE